MTPDNELEKLLAAATPGPWFVGGVRFKINGGDWHGIMSYNEAKKQDDNVCLVGYDPRTGEGHADARLICAAVNALPELLERVKRLEALAEDMQAIRIELRQTRGAGDYRTGWFAGAQAAYEEAAALLRARGE